MRVELIAATAAQQPIIGNLLELYMHDFTDYAEEEDGRFGYDRLPAYFVESDRHPFLAKADGKYAGFALVREVSPPDGAKYTDMAEFFVMRKYRRKGVGVQIARAAFDRFPGPWQVRVVQANLPAQPFWRRAIGEYTGGVFEEGQVNDEHWHGLVLTFVAGSPTRDGSR